MTRPAQLRCVVALLVTAGPAAWAGSPPAPARAAQAAPDPAGGLVLPASPRGVAVGDADGDGSAELALLLVYPAWGSQSDFVESPEGMEVNVVSAIEDRRELLVLRVAADGTLAAVAEPLAVGREVLAIGGESRTGPIVVLTDDGPQRLTIATGADRRRQVALTPIATRPSVLSGADSVFTAWPLLQDLDGDGAQEIVLPTESGFAALAADGSRAVELPAPFRSARSGDAPSLALSVPRIVDADRDGTLDLLDVWASVPLAGLRRGRGQGRFVDLVTWDIRARLAAELAPRVDAKGTRAEAEFLDVVDSDADGTLEAAVARFDPVKESLAGGLRALRALGATVSFFPLLPGGEIGPAKASVRTTGLLQTGGLVAGASSAFGDLDRDGIPEIVTLSLRVSYPDLARFAAAGAGSVDAGLRIYRRDRSGFVEVPDAAPTFRFSLDIGDAAMTRYAQFTEDCDGDGRLDFVVVDGRDLRIHGVQPGARVPRRPTVTLKLAAELRSFFGLRFVDVDGDGVKDIVAFEVLDKEQDNPSRPARVEVFFPRRVPR